MLTPEDITYWGDRLPLVQKLVNGDDFVWVDRDGDHSAWLAAGFVAHDADIAVEEIAGTVESMVGEPEIGEQLPTEIATPAGAVDLPLRRGPGRPRKDA